MRAFRVIATSPKVDQMMNRNPVCLSSTPIPPTPLNRSQSEFRPSSSNRLVSLSTLTQNASGMLSRQPALPS